MLEKEKTFLFTKKEVLNDTRLRKHPKKKRTVKRRGNKTIDEDDRSISEALRKTTSTQE